MATALGKPIAPFKIHDIRRTVRTHLSALPIPQHIAERIIGHAQPGLIQVYDRWTFLDEKRRGIELWEDRLRDIINGRQILRTSPPSCPCTRTSITRHARCGRRPA